MTALLSAHSVTSLDVVHHSDALAWLRGAPSDWIHCAVTSPPYFQQRDYGVEGQIGLESTPDAYVTRLVTVFRELRRVLRPDGTLWLNIADSYLPGKQLAGVPWRVAFALQADGWYLRSDIIWSRPNPMPESVRDRPTKAHEYVFLLSKSERYFYDADAIAEPSSNNSHGGGQAHDDRYMMQSGRNDGNKAMGIVTATRNKRSVWTVPASPSALPHFAMFPQALIEPMVLAGCPQAVCSACGAPYERVVEREAHGAHLGNTDGKDGALRNDTAKWAGRIGEISTRTLGWRAPCSCHAGTRPGIVYDPFLGSGTTALVAQRLGRHFVGTDINAEYVELARRRVQYRGDDRRMMQEQEAGVEQMALFEHTAA